MENFERNQKPKKPEMDAIDREAHEMFVESSVDALQEAAHIDEAEKLIMEQIEKGTLNLRMTVEEMIDALEIKKGELIGADDTLDEDNEDNEQEK